MISSLFCRGSAARSSKDSEDSEERCSGAVFRRAAPAHATLQWRTAAYTRSVCCPPDQPGPLRTDLRAADPALRACQRVVTTRSAQEANDTIRPFLSLHFSHFCRPPTDSASHWRTKMAGAAVWVRGGVGALVAQRA